MPTIAEKTKAERDLIEMAAKLPPTMESVGLAADDAQKWLAAYLRKNDGGTGKTMAMSLSSLVKAGIAPAKGLVDTLERFDRGEPVDDAKILALCWFVRREDDFGETPAAQGKAGKAELFGITPARAFLSELLKYERDNGFIVRGFDSAAALGERHGVVYGENLKRFLAGEDVRADQLVDMAFSLLVGQRAIEAEYALFWQAQIMELKFALSAIEKVLPDRDGAVEARTIASNALKFHKEAGINNGFFSS